VSAVDAPPGVAFAGRAAGELCARPRARRLARAVLVYVVGAGAATLALAGRKLGAPMVELLLVAPLVTMSIAAIGFAVRSARLRIDRDGVRWGWDVIGFRMRRARLARARIFRDAVALTPRRGSTWYLSARDWQPFDDVGRAMRRAELPFERHDRRAPLTARLQGYGLVLDLMLLGTALAATLALATAALL
jgi:hypothetical protein